MPYDAGEGYINDRTWTISIALLNLKLPTTLVTIIIISVICTYCISGFLPLDPIIIQRNVQVKILALRTPLCNNFELFRTVVAESDSVNHQNPTNSEGLTI
jgi:hypothetical protein